MSLTALYTDASKVNNGCTFPCSGGAVWFGSDFSGEGSENEYAVTFTYVTGDVNGLPMRGTLELKHVFTDVIQMLKSLQLKPPIVVSKLHPPSASPGATVTIYGSGFNALNQAVEVRFNDFPNNPMPAPIFTTDGTSLTFQVPTSIDTISCPAARIDVKACGVPIPPIHDDLNYCPPTL